MNKKYLIAGRLVGSCRELGCYSATMGPFCAAHASIIEMATVLVDGERVTGRVYHTRDNGWPCVETTEGRQASGPRVGTMDAFTRKHLAAWVDATLYEDERKSFTAWVETLDSDDLDYYERNGWPCALVVWRMDHAYMADNDTDDASTSTDDATSAYEAASAEYRP